MKKYGKATEKQIDSLITFMEDHLLHRKFTPAESANMRQVLYTIIHTAQVEAGNSFMKTLVQVRDNSTHTVGNELKKNLPEGSAQKASKLGAMIESLKAISLPPSF